jgi:hypothetical protein
MTEMLKLGKAPATHDPRDLLMARYTKDVDLPLLPTTNLGHPERVTVPWGMLGNDRYGDCVFAGGEHEHMLWSSMSGRTTPIFTDGTALADYGAVTGFTPSDPNSDQGTNMRDALNFRRNTGLVDAAQNRHKIGAFVAISPGDVTLLKEAIYLFGVAAVGIEFPQSAMAQFNTGKPWTVVNGSPIEGGHYVPIVQYLAAEDMFVCVTWGAAQKVAPTFLKKYMDEGYAMLTTDLLSQSTGKTIEGFDLASLNEDLSDLGGGTPVDPVPPEPVPVPVPTPPQPVDYVAASAELWSATKDWSAARHTGSNKKAATAVKEYAKKVGLS